MLAGHKYNKHKYYTGTVSSKSGVHIKNPLKVFQDTEKDNVVPKNEALTSYKYEFSDHFREYPSQRVDYADDDWADHKVKLVIQVSKLVKRLHPIHSFSML